MRKKIRLIVAAAILVTFVFTVGCGGEKETVRYEPPELAEPEPVEESPETALELEQPESPIQKELPEKVSVYLEMIHFDFDKSDLTPEAKSILAQNAIRLEDNPELYIRIEGHCDERGTVEYNLALGERRAISARNYLISYGIKPNRITIISYGKEKPLDARHNLEAWAKNRRAEFIILNQ
ncbi:MAG: peptidoglycan-associated lipoprotein Pal [bacterium]